MLAGRSLRAWRLTRPALVLVLTQNSRRTHPKYRDVVRKADQSVHVNLMKSKLGPLLASVEEYALEEFARFNDAIGKEGKVVSLHSLMYRLAYNVNCKR